MAQLDREIGAETKSVDAFYERLIVCAATIDELLSDDFEPLRGQKGDADLAARRLSTWCQACASGDWSLFGRRLDRDGMTIGEVLERFATVRRSASAPLPAWIEDATWIVAALQSPVIKCGPTAVPEQSEPHAFEHLFTAVVGQADAILWSAIDARMSNNLSGSARACLRLSLLRELSSLCTPALYERFAKARTAGATPPIAVGPKQNAGISRYDQFVADMAAGGFRHLFEDKPILLRLIATLTRQWIDTSREFVLRLDSDLTAIRSDLLHSRADCRVTKIEGNLSDRHNGGRSVQIVQFEDGARVVYKPKDLRLDVAWYALVDRLNRAAAPIELKAVRAISRDGYGWTEFIDHTGCTDADGCKRFFRRAGAWLALFHCFAATDMHQENMIAAGDHPVPIDLETILQAAADEHKSQDIEGQAMDAAMETIANSVSTIGLLPAYGRGPDNNIFSIGGMTADWNSKAGIRWTNINSDEMRPAKSKEAGATNPNLPHVDGGYAKFGDHIDEFVLGFEDYVKFLLHRTRDANPAMLFDGFAGLPVRKVVRPTRFYYMLLQRLRDHRSMDDGVIWSAQADFMARLAEWDKDADVLWPLQRAERSALVALNVPHFVSPSDGHDIRDPSGISIRTDAKPGLDRAEVRTRHFDERDIAWQIEVIRQNTASISRSAAQSPRGVELKQPLRSDGDATSAKGIFLAEADRIAAELSRQAIRRGGGAAWIGLDSLGDSEVFQLVPLGPDLYNGVSGIAVFLAAHAAVTGHKPSGELARAGISHLRKNLKGRNAARLARSVGIGGGTGLGSIVYALTMISKSLQDDALLADARVAAELFTDDLIAADKQLDVIGGSAGAILGLLRLYRDTQSNDVLLRATKCGEHLLRQPQVGSEGHRGWIGQGFGRQALNGMSHGAAGFAYALAALAAATGRDEFARAASDCIAFEDRSYDSERHNWPDLRGGGEPGWPCQWCHGAPGIGLARVAVTKRGGLDSRLLTTDIGNALAGVERGWPGQVDTLCCGTMGSIEFFCEAAGTLGRDDLRDLASRRLLTVLETAAAIGDYRWNSGRRQFNPALFRGLSGIGYTLLRRVDASLPNVIIWE
jgi:type 2 lantibiotic biosynthesis protein LanM